MSGMNYAFNRKMSYEQETKLTFPVSPRLSSSSFLSGHQCNSLSSPHRNSTKTSSIEAKSQKSNVIAVLSSKINLIPEPNPLNLHSLYLLIKSSCFTIHTCLYYLNNICSAGIIDTIINKIHCKYINDSFFYLPQLCALTNYKNYSNSIENYILENCVDKIKFSLIVYWLINAGNPFQTSLSTQIEMTLVNGHRANVSSRSSFIFMKKQTEFDIFHRAINKELRLSYFNSIISFYDELTKMCEKLIEIDKGERDSYMRKEILNIYENSKEIKQNIEGVVGVDSEIKHLYNGCILPFDDDENTSDDYSTLIVGVVPEMSKCFTTKARVPVKIVVECIKAYDCDKIEDLYDKAKEEAWSCFDKDKKETEEKEKLNCFNSINDFFKCLDEKEKEYKLKKQHTKNQREIDKVLKKIQYENTHPINKKEKFNKSISFFQSKSYSGFSLQSSSNIITSFTPQAITLFGDKWSKSIDEQRNKSPYGAFPTYTLKSFIAKSNDDLRQEHLAMQLIKTFDTIFKQANIPLRLHPYEILITSSSSGVIEYIPNTISLDFLKKNIPQDWNLNLFYRKFFNENFEEAQKNFAESLAAYSLVSYLIDIKDRHNGNILIDINGNIIHIDFGFILGISPGNLRFESAPFKLTNEYVDILDGVNSGMFQYFKSLLTRGFIEVKKHYERLSQIVEIIAKGQSDLPCFTGRKAEAVMNDFKSRFHLDKGEYEYFDIVEELVKESIGNWRTVQYDYFQKLTNDIRP